MKAKNRRTSAGSEPLRNPPPARLAEPPASAEIDQTRTVRDVKTLKALGNPLRVRILEALTTRAMSAKELSGALGESQTKLYRHIHLLESHDLVRVVGTRVVSGLDERLYRATAYKFVIDRKLVSFDEPAGRHALDALLGYVLDETKRDIQRSVDSGIIDLAREVPHPRSLYTRRLHVRLTATQATELQQKLESMVNDAMAESSEDQAQLFAMSITFYPTGSAPSDEPSTEMPVTETPQELRPGTRTTATVERSESSSSRRTERPAGDPTA